MVNDNCCVPFCSNHFAKNGRDISWHTIPKNDNLKKEWIVKIRRDVGKNFKITMHSKVCSAHFIESDFRPILHPKKRLLKVGAIPSVFIWNDEKVIFRIFIVKIKCTIN